MVVADKEALAGLLAEQEMRMSSTQRDLERCEVGWMVVAVGGCWVVVVAGSGSLWEVGVGG